MNRHEMRTLGRISQPLSGGTYRPRRRLRAPRWLAVVLSVAVLTLLWVGVAATGQVGTGEIAAPARTAVPGRRAAGAQVSRSARRSPVVFATLEGLALRLPHPQPLAVAFHEASQVQALALAPTGRLVANDNPTRFTPADTPGADYSVLSSRDRARPPTSAADIVVPLGERVSAPVDGTVTAVTQYPLYGRVRDWRVEITPTGRPDLTIVLIHLLNPAVSVGTEVVAGQTSLAEVRLLPFDSHVDYLLARKQPHAHLEVKPSVDAAPIDPNEPARPADEEETDGL